MQKILAVLSGSDHLILKDGTITPAGFWAEEFVVPHEQFRAAGLQVDVATPGGIVPTVDPSSLSLEMNEGKAEVVEHYKSYLASLEELKSPKVLETIREDELLSYDAIFLPGGHGPLEDLAHLPAMGWAVSRMHRAGRLIVAVCHGPAGLLPAREANGEWIFQGYEVTGFTNDEEEAVRLLDKLPVLLESSMRELGGKFRKAPAFEPNLVTDRNLITGQNPASAAGVAHETIVELGMVLAR